MVAGLEVTLATMCSATCDPYYALLPLVHFICVFVQRGNPEERAAGGNNENVPRAYNPALSQNGNRLKSVAYVCCMQSRSHLQLIEQRFTV